jgi:hypothetical protein
MNKEIVVEPETVSAFIHHIRGKRVLLDRDLATFFQTETKKINQTVQRNINRFPEDFMFRLTESEYTALKRGHLDLPNKTIKNKYFPYVFTEIGVITLGGLFKSEWAIRVSVSAMRAFLRIKELTEQQYYMEQKLQEFEMRIFDRLTQFEERFKWISQPLSLPSPVSLSTYPHSKKTNQIEIIKRHVAEFFSLTLTELKASTRRPAIAFPRQIAMYLTRELLHVSYKEIAESFGSKDHTTILHACQKVEKRLETDSEFKSILLSLKETLTFLLRNEGPPFFQNSIY